MFKSKKYSRFICTLVVSLLLFTGCSPDDKTSTGNASTTTQSLDKISEEAMGRFVQTDISPTESLQGITESLSQNSKGELLLNILPYSEYGRQIPRAFIYSDNKWIEKDNEFLKKFITENKPKNSSETVIKSATNDDLIVTDSNEWYGSAFSDFYDNWWFNG